VSQFFVKDLNGKRGGISARNPAAPLPERLQDKPTETILPASTPYDGIPYVGCAATIPVGSDSYPGTVSWVSKQTVEAEWRSDYEQPTRKVQVPKRIRVRKCDYRGVEGHSNVYTESQKYVYFEKAGDQADEGAEYSWRPQRNGYVRKGTSSRSSAAQRIGLGFRRAYYDPSF
jgi:hypothetical protein